MLKVPKRQGSCVPDPQGSRVVKLGISNGKDPGFQGSKASGAARLQGSEVPEVSVLQGFQASTVRLPEF